MPLLFDETNPPEDEVWYVMSLIPEFTLGEPNDDQNLTLILGLKPDELRNAIENASSVQVHHDLIHPEAGDPGVDVFKIEPTAEYSEGKRRYLLVTLGGDETAHILA